MIFVILFVWLFTGSATMTYLLRPVKELRWIDLAVIIGFAWLGPSLLIAIGGEVLLEAKFWDKKILK